MQRLVYLLSTFYILALLFLMVAMPITPHEARNYFALLRPSHELMHLIDISHLALPWRSAAVRLPYFLFGLGALVLVWQLIQSYWKLSKDRYWAWFMFALTPGFVMALVMANEAIVALSVVLLFLVAFRRGNKTLVVASMVVLLFAHQAALLFYIALLLYALLHHKKLCIVLSFLLGAASLYMGAFVQIGGVPSGHFLETIALYSVLFSPFLFLYYFYGSYRMLLRPQRDIVWYVGFIPFVVSLLLSMRQKIYITDFAPYMLPALIVVFAYFAQSYRVRLRQFRRAYRSLFTFVFVVQLFMFLLLLMHPFSATLRSTGGFGKIYRPYEKALGLADKKGCYKEQKSSIIYQSLLWA